MKNEELGQFIFHFNPYTEDWACVKRENYPKLFSNREDKSVTKSKNINTLIEFITKNQK